MKVKVIEESNDGEPNGKKTNYYNIIPNPDGYVDVDCITSQLGMTFAEGNCLKALVGIAIARSTGTARHSGTSGERDANKLVHYAALVKKSQI